MVLVDATAIPPSMVLPTGIAGWVHQNANHRHIPAEAKEVFDLGKSLFLKCAFVLPDAAQELTRGEDFVTHAPGNDLGPHRHEQTQGNAEFFANVNGSHICRGAATNWAPNIQSAQQGPIAVAEYATTNKTHVMALASAAPQTL